MKALDLLKPTLALLVVITTFPKLALSQSLTVRSLQETKLTKIQNTASSSTNKKERNQGTVLKSNDKEPQDRSKEKYPELRKRAGGTGVDGGGGNLRSGPPMTRKQLVDYLANSNKIEQPTSPQKTLKMIFNSAYSSYTGYLFGIQRSSIPGWNDTSFRIHKLLFNPQSQDNIYSTLRQAKIVLQDEACHVPGTDELSDASADLKSKLICLSWQRLSSKLFVNNFESYLIPLLVHEYSHFVGLNEEEAEFLEDLIRDEVNTEKLGVVIDDNMEAFLWDLELLKEKALDLERTSARSSPQSICVKSYKLFQLLEDIALTISPSQNVTLFDRHEQVRYETLRLRLFNLMRVCYAANLDELISDSDADFLKAAQYIFQKEGSQKPVLSFIAGIYRFYSEQGISDTELTKDHEELLPHEGFISDVSCGNSILVASEIRKARLIIDWLTVRMSPSN